MRRRHCVEIMLPCFAGDPRQTNSPTIDIWVWSESPDKARRTVENRLQRLIGDGLEDPGPELDDDA